MMPSQTARSHEQQIESEAIRQTTLDYVEGWYEGDAGRMQRCLHPSLVKRAVKQVNPSGKEYLNYLTKEVMVLNTEAGYGKHVPVEQRVYRIVILDISGNIASVRAESPDWIDYLHLAKLNGKWLIANALYTTNPYP